MLTIIKDLILIIERALGLTIERILELIIERVLGLTIKRFLRLTREVKIYRQIIRELHKENIT